MFGLPPVLALSLSLFRFRMVVASDVVPAANADAVGIDKVAMVIVAFVLFVDMMVMMGGGIVVSGLGEQVGTAEPAAQDGSLAP